MVRSHRQRLGMTQDELAETTGLSVRNVRNLEAGRTSSPRPATVRLLADAFGLTGVGRERFNAIAAGESVAQPDPAALRVPSQLPADVSAFTGRGDQLRQLDSWQAAAGNQPTAPVISAIVGTAGVGKSALALHWAHRNAELFTDGQLYLNLRGYDPDMPVTAADALARLLAALGVAGGDIPLDQEDRANRYRSEVADRSLLIVLDNAASGDQVRPLLPGTGSCTVMVTSRDSLGGLVALNGARRLDLDLFPLGDAVTLLRRLIGPRVDAEPESAKVLSEQCVRLPLALRIAAELAVSRDSHPLSDLAQELRDRQHRMEMLDGGEPHARVRTVFSWSVQHLPPDVARAFRLLGLHPGPDTDPYAAAALIGVPLEHARRALSVLGRAHLVHVTGPDRHSMHDLLRSYACHLGVREDTDQSRQAAIARLFDYYLAAAAAAMDSWYPAEKHRRPRIPVTTAPFPGLTDPDKAHAWLDTELSCLVAMAVHAATHGRQAQTIRLSAILYRYLNGGHYAEALTIHGHAHNAAEQIGDLAAQGYALRSLGAVHARLGRYESAGRYNEGAVELFRQVDDTTGRAIALDNLGATERRLGRYESAVRCHEDALALFGKMGDETGQASALNGLGNAEEQLGRHEVAAGHYRQALRLCRKLSDVHGQATVLDGLGTVHISLGQPDRARRYLMQALALYRKSGEQAGEAWTLNSLGDAARSVGDHMAARTHHTAALALAEATGTRDQQARALAGLGWASQSIDDTTRATEFFENALLLYADLGMPEAEHVRGHLAALAG